MIPSPPRCFNRPPMLAGRTLHGVNRDTGEPVATALTNDWTEDRCATWAGVGIGQPTPEYPTGTPYPIAHGWAPWCQQCRWMPAREESGMMNKNGLQDEVGMLDPAELDFDPARLAVERMAGLVLDTTEAAIRAKLIELGWTPPEWQPIDTAPRDGTAVLVFDRIDKVQTTAFWHEDGMRRTGTRETGQWLLLCSDAYIERQSCALTHWKPLGPNPEEA